MSIFMNLSRIIWLTFSIILNGKLLPIYEIILLVYLLKKEYVVTVPLHFHP